MASVESRSLAKVLVLSALGLGAGLALWPLSATADESEPCQTKKFHYPKVEAACKEGGRKAAKKVMMGVVKKAKDAGEKDTKCTSCHEDTKSYKLKSNAVDDLKKWI